MKPLYKYFYTVALAMAGLLLNSCADETTIYSKVEVIDDIPVTVNLSFTPNSSTAVTTKATEAEEDAVKDLYIITFKSNGSFSDKHYFTNEQLTAFGKHADGKGGKIQLNTTSGLKKVFAVANVGTTNFSSDGSTSSTGDLKARIDAFFAGGDNSLNSWLQFTATMVNKDADWGSGHFLMSGKFGETAESVTDGSCLFTLDNKIYNAEGTALSEGKIWLTRTAASVTFNVFANTNNIKFSMTSWEICNIPKTVNLFADNTNHTTDVFQPENFNGSFSNNSFNFYMLENLQGNKSAAIDNHSRRANAPKHATYVVIKGKYEGPGKHKDAPEGSSPEQVMADVTYYVYLGYMNKDGKTQEDSNFDVYRNFRYTYNIKVNGVQDIIVEAEGGSEDEDKGVDGNVLFAGSFIEVDSHYSRQKLSFGRIAEEEVDAVKSLVRSYKTGWEEKDIFKADGTYDTTVDISWVHFVKASVVKALWADGGKGPDFTLTGDARLAAGIMDLNELVAALKTGDAFFGLDKENNPLQSVDVYAYIDENYYEKQQSISSFVNDQPGTVTDKTRSMKINLKNTVSAGGGSTVSSAEYVILQKPIVTIFDTRYNGGWGFEYYNENLPGNYDKMTLSQKAIDAGIYFGTVTGWMTKDDGYANVKTEYGALGNKSWTNVDIIGKYNESNPDDLDLNNAKAYLACMGRNRDENGDGVIDEGEIKWYLPAINQYEYYWVGWDAIPKDATLFPEEHRNQSLKEIRETFSFHSSGRYRFQADEGSAVRGPWHEDNAGRMHVRCARNIGTGTEVKIASASSYTDNSFTVGVVGLPQTSLRQTAQRDKLLSHNEYDKLNRLYKTIEVKKNTIGAVRTPEDSGPISGFSETGRAESSLTIAEYVNKDNNNPCDYYNTGGETGWRPANQRELIAIHLAGKDFVEGSGHEYAQTMFSLWDWENWTEKGLKREVTKTGEPNSYSKLIAPAARVGYSYNGDQMELPFRQYSNDGIWGEKETGYTNDWAHDFNVKIRCVRDK